MKDIRRLRSVRFTQVEGRSTMGRGGGEIVRGRGGGETIGGRRILIELFELLVSY